MGKSSRFMRGNMYENDVLDFDTLDDLATPIKSNKAIKQALKKAAETTKPKSDSQGSKSTVSTKPVDATCNKCKNKVVGELIGDIYICTTDKMVPLISYSCTHCGHVGRRSCMTLGLPLDQYERKYFN
jgi:hypothetical protein